MRILLVEDTLTIGAEEEKLLADAGHEVVWVLTATDALAALEAGSFDVMVLDLVLSGSSGFRVLRDAGRLPPRVVVTTGMVPAEVSYLPTDLPAKITVLYKPYEFESLLAAVAGTT